VLNQHPQEKIVETLDYNGITVEIVEWTDTIWCGKIEYAESNVDEPNVEKMSEDYFSLTSRARPVDTLEGDWSVCISANYLSRERPNGVMYASLVASDRQPDGFDVYKVPAAKYARIRMCDETAKALGHEPWRGGIPPFEWIGEQIAPKIGYKYGDDKLPIYEYYGFYNPKKKSHEFGYLYVPVDKRD
jgi:hypothetical protein